MIHTNWPRSCLVFPLLCELTRSAIYGSQKFDSHKWPSMLVDEVKGKPCNFEACLCGSLYSTFTTSFYSYAFYNRRLQTLFKDQLDRSKATCSFKKSKLQWYGKPLANFLTVFDWKAPLQIKSWHLVNFEK